jgi:putative DNA methylase
VDDPSSHPDQFPTEEAQEKERLRLFDILERLVVWENSNDEQLLEEAKTEIARSTDGNIPELLDPFAGGGAIPLEAQRLGLKAHASDLNPVAVMINKAMIEIPPKFKGMSPVNPKSRSQLGSELVWKGSTGLAEDVKYYGQWMRDEAFKRIGHLYPRAKLSDGTEATVIAWIWARTVKCPNPACGCAMPLARSFTLSKKKGKEYHVELDMQGNKIHYHVEPGVAKKIEGTVNRKGAICPCCGAPVGFDYIRNEAISSRMNSQLISIVGESRKGRIYFSPNTEHINAAKLDKPHDYPLGSLSYYPGCLNTNVYGLDDFSKLFTNRQLTALTTFSDLVAEAQLKAYEDAVEAGMANDGVGLDAGGSAAKAYGEAIGVYLAFLVDKLADYNSTICSWNITRDGLRNTFGRQAIPMVWDYAEANPFSNSTGCIDNTLTWITKCILEFPINAAQSQAKQADATRDNGMRSVMISTDPPYYDNIPYAYLADFFYIWMRQSLKNTFPTLFNTLLTPKVDELTAIRYRFDGGRTEAKTFFEDGMLRTFRQVHSYTRDDVPVTIYYAFKQSETKSEDDNNTESISTLTASTGWETMLSAVIQAGFSITGTWPIRTERSVRSVALGSNALASSIVLVCRKRHPSASLVTRRDFLATLRRELKPALVQLQHANIAPVDLAQSAIGPGMAVYSRNGKILDADGTPMSVRAALQIINQLIDEFFNEQEGDLDSESRFCVDLFSQVAFNPIKYGTAEVLATAKAISISNLAQAGVLTSSKGSVQLMYREDLQEFTVSNTKITWLVTQQLTYAFEKFGIDGSSKILARLSGTMAENAKALAYRLYTIAERKGWSSEAYAYNVLVSSWMDIQQGAANQRIYREGEFQFD